MGAATSLQNVDRSYLVRTSAHEFAHANAQATGSSDAGLCLVLGATISCDQLLRSLRSSAIMQQGVGASSSHHRPTLDAR
jgi:hypothetical protein